MSFVTSVVLIFPKTEDEESRINEVDAFEYKDQSVSLCSIEDAMGNRDILWYGGNKNVISHIYIGSFNNFDSKGFLKHLSSSVKWEKPEHVQVLIQSEDEWMFNIYGNAGKDLLIKALGEKG